MVAYDSRRTPDPSQRLSPEAADALRNALRLQSAAGQEPLPELRAAIGAAAHEARDRKIRPESLLAQLNELLSEAAVDKTPQGTNPNRGLREWLMMACFRAYWQETS